MTTGDEPIHPTPWIDGPRINGLSKREWLAGMAMTNFCATSNGAWTHPNDAALIASESVRMADALLDELDKPRE